MSENRAYSTFTIKTVELEKREFGGWATTPATDRVNDIVEPKGVTFSNPVPLLLHHDHSAPVGSVVLETPTSEGVRFRAHIPKFSDASPAKARADDAWESVRHGLIRAVSIGFRVLDNAVERLQNGGLRYLSTEVFELSLVSVPAQPGATIDPATIKRFDVAAPAEPRPAKVVKLHPNGPQRPEVDRRISELRTKRRALLNEREGAMGHCDYIRVIAIERALVGLDALLINLETRSIGQHLMGTVEE